MRRPTRKQIEEARKMGARAWRGGKSCEACPFKDYTLRAAWADGWLSAGKE